MVINYFFLPTHLPAFLQAAFVLQLAQCLKAFLVFLTAMITSLI